MSAVEYKECLTCKEIKPLIDFGIYNRYEDGHSRYCKKCKNNYDSNWRSINKSKIKKSSKTWMLNKPKSVILTSAKSRAKQEGSAFNITVDDFDIPEYCPILGFKLKEVGIGKRSKNSPSLDRIDPRLGYTKGNVRVISSLANTMKQDATPEQLYTFCTNILKDLKGIN